MLNFLHSHNVILAEKICPKCGRTCKYSQRRNTVFSFRCTGVSIVAKPKKKKQKVACSFQQSVRSNTFFGGSNFSLRNICSLVILEQCPIKDLTEFLESELDWSRQSVVDWRRYIREVYIDWCINNSRPTIGGPGKIVEIDEIIVGQRKYNCGRLVEGQWVLTGIEKRSGDFFVIPVEARSTETLLDIIKERIADGTTIKSNCWRSYNCLNDERYRQQAVNHSKKFLEGNIPHCERKKDEYLGNFAKYLFYKRFNSHKDRIHEIFMAIGKLYDPSKQSIVKSDVHFDLDFEDGE